MFPTDGEEFEIEIAKYLKLNYSKNKGKIIALINYVLENNSGEVLSTCVYEMEEIADIFKK
jgi:hypothetical protein